MRGNLSLRRIFLLVLASVILFAFMTLSIFSAVSPHIFATSKLEELKPRADFLAEKAGEYFSAPEEQGSAMSFFGLNSQLWGATVYLLDAERNVMVNSDQNASHTEYVQYIEGFEVLVQEVLTGVEVVRLGYILEQPNVSTRPANLLFIGVPVIVDDVVMGAVIMLKPLDEFAVLSSLSSALWLSALAVVVLMMPAVYWFSRRITRPIRQMRDVALRMAGGDFGVRANDAETGEAGDLARALNYLSSQLGSTIAELTHERNQAVTIVNALGEGVLSVNTEGLPMMTNPALQTMLFTAGEGKPLPLPQSVWEDFQTALREKRCTDSTFTFGCLLLHLTITPITDPKTGRTSAIGVFHDETQAFQLEQTRREYVANVSHELRTPLTALRALIEPLRDGLIRTEEQRQDIYNIILRETMRLARLVDDMLELSRLQSGKLALEKIRFKVDTILRETASTYAAKAADTGHRLMLELGDEPLPTVLGNPDRAEQVLVALLNNAFTYTPSGSTIILRARVGEECMYISVEDDGPGIKDDDLPNVFERFYKADKSHGGTTGTGLGLAIARELMHRMGEDITVANRPGGGAVFTFTLHYQ